MMMSSRAAEKPMTLTDKLGLLRLGVLSSLLAIVTVPAVASSAKVQGQCNMGTCDWLRIETPEIVKSNRTESLKKVKMVMGESVNPYDKKTPIRWGDPGDEYVFCSTRLPAVIFPDVQHNGKWVAQSLAPGYPEGTPHYLTDANIEYFKVMSTRLFRMTTHLGRNSVTLPVS
jgi:hypothetical protein